MTNKHTKTAYLLTIQVKLMYMYSLLIIIISTWILVDVLQRTKVAPKKSVSLISDMQHVTR